MSPTSFWDKYLADDADCFIMQFNEERGEKKIQAGKWEDPETDEDKCYDWGTGLHVATKRVRKTFMDVQVKGNPLCRVAPTYTDYYLTEKTPNLIILRAHSFSKEVPYCDCFSYDQEWVIAMPQNCNNSSVLRITMAINFHKSTIMKGMISRESLSIARGVWEEWKEWVKKKGSIFK